MKLAKKMAAVMVCVTMSAGAVAHAAEGETQWKPSNPMDTCTQADHEKFMVTGPDGRRYDGWHPSVYEREDGTSCRFGHEHGDNPRDSHIYDWTIAKLQEMAKPGLKVTGLPFGYVSHQSHAYAEATGGALAHRHEDHYGHKVYVLNDVKLVNQDRTKGYVRDASGQPVTCNYLIKMHQGSHSADATRNNAHEMIYAVQCTDGTEAVISAFDIYGNPNEFTESCTGKAIRTAGSNLPQGNGGRRSIPTSDCLNKYTDVWAPYERWEGDTRIQSPNGGQLLAQYSPFFGVRNPSRVWDSAAGATTATANVANSGVRFAIPGYKVAPGTGQFDLESAFDGAKRDVYVAGTMLKNAGGPTRWYTNPYGGTPSQSEFAGAVPQYIAAVDNSAAHAGVAHQAFGFSKDYAKPEDFVHAPS